MNLIAAEILHSYQVYFRTSKKIICYHDINARTITITNTILIITGLGFEQIINIERWIQGMYAIENMPNIIIKKKKNYYIY